MAIHQLDELTPITRRVRNLEAQHGKIGVTADGAIGAFPLAGDLEQTAVRFDIPTKSGGIILGSATVDHDGDAVLAVHFPQHFRDWAAAAGLERDDLCFEGWLEATAKMEFARQSVHLTCGNCERAKRDATAKCEVGGLHDWRVAR